METKPKQNKLRLMGWLIVVFISCMSCGDKDVVPLPKPPDKDDDSTPGEQVVVPKIMGLKAVVTDKPNELLVTWLYPSEAVSAEIACILEGANETNTIRRNIVRPTGYEGFVRIDVPEYGNYNISGWAVDREGNRSEKETVTATPMHEDDVFKNFPVGKDPKTIGRRLAERFIRTISSSPHNRRTNYPYVCTWLGAFRVADANSNQAMYDNLRTRYDNSFLSSAAPTLPSPDHVDNNVFGSVPLEIYKKVKENKYIELGLDYADRQWELPRNPTSEQLNWHNQGYSWQTRIWIDDMFMITALQAQAYQTTGSRDYIDRAARQMAMYLSEIQRPNGLFHHTPTVPYYWARGNGWMAVGMAELLRVLPQDNPDRKKIEDAYKLMMKTLLQYQTEDGMWRQLIDKSELWKETSGTAMFAYAMIIGVKKGWLDKITYGGAARKAWLSLLTYINEDDNVRDVCEGTNAYNDYAYYVNRRRITGDLHGQAPMLWCAYALESDL